MTDTGALKILKLYLSGKMGFDYLEDQVVALAWDDTREDRDLIYAVLIEIAYIKDDVSDEATFRNRISGFISASAMSQVS